MGDVIRPCFKCKGTGNIYEELEDGYASATACDCDAGKAWVEEVKRFVGLADDAPDGTVTFRSIPSDTGIPPRR